MSDAPVSFEVQLMLQNKWHTDSVFDESTLATDEALRALEGSRRPQAVRVVREAVDPATNLIVSTTIFRKTQADEAAREARRQREKENQVEKLMERSPRSKPVNKGEARLVKQRSPQTAAKKKGMNTFIVALVLTASLLVGGMMAIAGLNSFFTTK